MFFSMELSPYIQFHKYGENSIISYLFRLCNNPVIYYEIVKYVGN